MRRATPHILEKSKRNFFVLAATLLVLLSSCAVKASIKSLAGLPINTEQRVPKSARNFTLNLAEKCDLLDASEIKMALRTSPEQGNDLLPVLIFTAAFLFIIGAPIVCNDKEHPAYRRSEKIRHSIPLFLEYRKLLIHHTA